MCTSIEYIGDIPIETVVIVITAHPTVCTTGRPIGGTASLKTLNYAGTSARGTTTIVLVARPITPRLTILNSLVVPPRAVAVSAGPGNLNAPLSPSLYISTHCLEC